MTLVAVRWPGTGLVTGDWDLEVIDARRAAYLLSQNGVPLSVIGVDACSCTVVGYDMHPSRGGRPRDPRLWEEVMPEVHRLKGQGLKWAAITCQINDRFGTEYEIETIRGHYKEFRKRSPAGAG